MGRDLLNSPPALLLPEDETLIVTAPAGSNIPASLRRLPQWVVYRREANEMGKLTKLPYQPHAPSYKASSTNCDTWSTFDDACAAVRNFGNKLDGVGFVFTATDPYCGIDLDHCVQPDGELTPFAQRIVDELDSYAEFSPSGDGIHVLVKAEVPQGKKNQRIEIYSKGRYFTVTGRHVEGTPHTVNDRQDVVMRIWTEEFPERPQDEAQRPVEPVSMDDQRILQKARTASNGARFIALYDRGETDASASEADLALCNMLAFWTGRDPARIDQLFRASALMRQKWDERHYGDGRTYGQATIEKAIAGATETFSGGGVHVSQDSIGLNGAHPQRPLDAWPEPPHDAAFYGEVGRIVDILAPNSEADRVALLVNLLLGYGNLVGTNAWLPVGVTKHYPREFALLIGDSSKARKGESWRTIRPVLSLLDPGWSTRETSGISSGEAIIEKVRDAVTQNEQKDGEWREVVTDPGVIDKRLFVIESEFGRLLKVMQRKGDTTSATVRQAWDDEIMRITTRSSGRTATGAHVTIVGHITEEELKHDLADIEMANGFMNRFLPVCVKRSKLIANPIAIEIDEGLTEILEKNLIKARTAGDMGRDRDAYDQWEVMYAELAKPERGLSGAVLSRAETHVARLSMFYALTDGSRLIRVEHQDAAKALWDYCERSARYLFGDALGNSTAEKILRELRVRGRLTMNDIKVLFSNNLNQIDREAAVDVIVSSGKAVLEKRESGGRPTEILVLR